MVIFAINDPQREATLEGDREASWIVNFNLDHTRCQGAHQLAGGVARIINNDFVRSGPSDAEGALH